MPHLPKIQQLEKLTDQNRFNWILDHLQNIDIQYKVHEYSTGKNIIVPSSKNQKVIVASHFDTVPGSPGANDNGSAIAVCLDILERLKKQPPRNVGVDVFFFDEEEKGLIGSEAYCLEHGTHEYIGMINMELVGQGNIFALWPLNDESSGMTLQTFESVAKDAGVPSRRFDQIVTNSADHRSFREHGLADAFTITCISPTDIQVAQKYYSALAEGRQKEELRQIMAEAPLFKNYHQSTDNSTYLSEDSIQMTANAIWETIRAIDRKV